MARGVGEEIFPILICSMTHHTGCVCAHGLWPTSGITIGWAPLTGRLISMDSTGVSQYWEGILGVHPENMNLPVLAARICYRVRWGCTPNRNTEYPRMAGYPVLRPPAAMVLRLRSLTEADARPLRTTS